MAAQIDNILAQAANDPDVMETREWLDALESVIEHEGAERAHYLLERMVDLARRRGAHIPFSSNTAYVNTIPAHLGEHCPGNLEYEERLRSWMRWNAMAMVVKTNRSDGDLGGHISSFASLANMLGIGFNHFWHAPSENHGGDLLYIQGHSAPGIYARAFLEGRITEEQMLNFRREVDGKGLSSYPHPKLMPDFWQFPTVSMGLGPLMAIYQARFLKYLHARQIADTANRKVWAFCGDGEMDEPESMGAIGMAGREMLDNLVFVINCNLQRLDGPVRGNGHIVDELETLFGGAGWNVIKLLWGSDWDPLFARDHTGDLVDALNRTVDGQLQTFAANDGAFNREHFFGQNPALKAIGDTLTDDEIDRLKRGGHDMRKIYAAYHAAANHNGRPTVILAQTKKGFGMGAAGQGKMTTHQQKKLELDDLLEFRDRFKLPLNDAQIEKLEFCKPASDSEVMRHLQERRQQLGGYLPQRITSPNQITLPDIASHAKFALDADGKEMSTTMALVRIMGNLLKDAELGKHVVPIVADEARTFGMANLFRQVGIYSAQGQLYQPEDIGSILYYREATDGQILEEGITEAGAISSWTAAATSYAVHGLPMLPFYIYYSMFGFQRIGDLIWAAADQRARGFLIGATSGRTTLGGEGLQHQDGSSHLVSATIPNCISYDPAFAYELAVIVDDGMRRMLSNNEDLFYYVTVTNENEAQPSMPASAREGILRGMHCVVKAEQAHIRLLGAGPLLKEAMAAAALLKDNFSIHSDVWSVTSFSELARDGIASERSRRLQHATEPSWVSQQLSGSQAPVIAVSDYVRAVPESIRAYIPAPYVTLGTDGFGRSDTRASLRDFFEVDAKWIAYTALVEIYGDKKSPDEMRAMAATLGLNLDKPIASSL